MVKVTLVEATDILSAFSDALRQYAEKKIKKRDQFTLLKDAVAGKPYTLLTSCGR